MQRTKKCYFIFIISPALLMIFVLLVAACTSAPLTTITPTPPVTTNQTLTEAEVEKIVSEQISKQVAYPIVATTPPNRGCPACHGAPHTLASEAINATQALGAGHTHPQVSDNATVLTCLTCHGSAPDGKGVSSPIDLRDIVHPVHLGSQVFKVKIGGSCFSCHNISWDGVFQILTEKVQTNDKGVPDLGQIPIPGAINPK